MRRKEQEITDQAELDAILARAAVCHLGMVDGDRPYVVPVCYGYRDRALYVHSAPEGYKIELLRRNPQVCFQVEADLALQPAEKACGWGIQYSSVIGWGRAVFLDDAAQKRAALDVIMAHYGASGPYVYAEKTLAKTTILKVEIESMTGKRSYRAS